MGGFKRHRKTAVAANIAVILAPAIVFETASSVLGSSAMWLYLALIVVLLIVILAAAATWNFAWRQGRGKPYLDDLVPEDEDGRATSKLHKSTKIRVDKPVQVIRRRSISDTVYNLSLSMLQSAKQQKPLIVRNLESFIHNLFYQFKAQRWPRGFKKSANQFCVLHISSIQSGVELEFASRFHSQTSKVNLFGNNDPLTSRDIPSFPLDKDLYNYITSRPTSERHAVELVIDKFEILYQNYTTCNTKDKVRIVILYSWLFPCQECIKKLIRTVRIPHGEEGVRLLDTACNVYLVYSRVIKSEASTLSKLIEKLTTAGINVLQVSTMDNKLL